MRFVAPPSIASPPRPRQSARAQGGRACGGLIALGLMLSGCAGISMPLSMWGSSSNEPPTGEITTGSIAKPGTGVPRPSVPAPLPDTDGDVIRRVLPVAPLGDAPTAWRNEATGNSGTLAKIVQTKAVNGAPCRDFETTLVTVQGVRLYRGRACLGYTGPWDLVTFDPVDPLAPG